MTTMNQQKPKPGEKWKYLTGQLFEIIDVDVDPDSGKEVVVYREDESHQTLWKLEMDDFMAALPDGNNTVTPFFYKV